ncbi:MAG: 4-hydroxy-3-methylbut-2-enyl diphosphate reductase [Betaproteobacteria bacterium]|jgi:4-hydroxy-3-methylbut-2-enyl diphosphate reductase|nr:4-hydroxy-3-methylbut-2-enyl diphosphate reductase [Betaproteobacteria bacterium]
MGHLDAEILLAQPRGFCAGVDRAISIVQEALNRFGAPIYVRHQIIHNARVIAELTAQGAVFINELDEVPAGATLIFSAHGVSAKVRTQASARDFRIFDATCPLVNKVHAEVKKLHFGGMQIVMIGHAGHPEVEGTMGQVVDRIHLVQEIADVDALHFPENTQVAYVTQTTLSIDETRDIIAALEIRFPQIQHPKKQDICYATQNRQDAVKELVPMVDVVIVVGSPNSSNSNRLRELGQRLGVRSYLVDHPDQLERAWFEGQKRVGLTAGASAPESLTQEILERIRDFGPRVVKTLPGVEENTIFALPKGLGK